MKTPNNELTIPKNIILPFILLASCFMWWGIANNLTDPLVRVFKEIFRELSTFESSLIQFAFYGGYFCMAIPGALIARKYSYKTGVLAGLGVYILGCFLLYPAMLAQVFGFFMIAYYVLACGLGILETNANPYIIALGPEKTATRRLNFAQAFNPLGSVIGIVLAQIMIFANLPRGNDGQLNIEPSQISESLNIVILPYLSIAAILVVVWILIAFVKMPKISEPNDDLALGVSFRRLFRNSNYTFAVIAQFFYVGAQITVWTYTNFYIPEHLGVEQEVALQYHTWALILFGLSRWVFTWLMKFYSPSSLLLFASISASILTLVSIFVGGVIGVYSLIGISIFMSLMFPTIFGLGSENLGKDTKIGSSGLIMAILGGAIITPLQGKIIDSFSVDISYFVPLFCFIVILAYALFRKRVQVNLGTN